DAQRDAAVRWRAVVERVEDRPELLAHRLRGLALQGERALEQVAAPDADGPAPELPAVEDDVVLQGTSLSRWVARRGPIRIAGRGHEERLILGQHPRERVVGGVPALVLRIPFVHREARDPRVREDVLVNEPESRAEVGAELAEDLVRD